MRVFLPVVLAASLLATNLYAADTSAPLAPGKPAGVQKADLVGGTALMILGAGALIAVLAIAAPSGNSTVNPAPNSTTAQ